ncbi:MAG: anti-sigma factor [Leucobacter sp.]
MNENEFRELSAAHALHALPPNEEQEFSAALVAHPEWQAIVDVDRETAAALGAVSGDVTPPASARSTILDAIATLPQDATEAESDVLPVEMLIRPKLPNQQKRPLHAGVRRAMWFALAASVAVLLGLTITPWMRASLTPPNPVEVALEQVEAAPDATTASTKIEGGGQATLHWSAATDQAVFLAEGLPGLDTDRDFELWIVRGEDPISLGVITVDESRDAAVLPDGFEVGDAIAITVEDRGGSATGAPTTDPIVVVASA